MSHLLHTPNGKYRGNHSGGIHFKSPCHSNKKPIINVGGANGTTNPSIFVGAHHHHNHGVGMQSYSGTHGQYGNFLKSPLVNKHSKRLSNGGGNSDSSSKKIGLFNNSGSAFLEGRSWNGISPVCSRIRDQITLPNGGSHFPHKGERLFLEQSPPSMQVDMHRANSTITAAWPMQSPPGQDTAKRPPFYQQTKNGVVAQSTGCSFNK
jgi:hypothetical protein